MNLKEGPGLCQNHPQSKRKRPAAFPPQRGSFRTFFRKPRNHPFPLPHENEELGSLKKEHLLLLPLLRISRRPSLFRRTGRKNLLPLLFFASSLKEYRLTFLIPRLAKQEMRPSQCCKVSLPISSFFILFFSSCVLAIHFSPLPVFSRRRRRSRDPQAY